MADGQAVTAEQIRGGAEAMARNPAAAARSIEAGVIGDLRDGATQAGLERAAMRTPSFTAIRSLEDGNVGHRDNLNVVQRNGNETILHTTATTRIDLLQDFVENGYANMGANQATILGEVRDAIVGSAEMSSRFGNLTARQIQTEATRMAQEYLGDPNFRDTVIDLVMKRADLSHPIGDQVSEIVIKLEDLRAERLRITQAGGEQPVAVADETSARNRLSRYVEDPNGNAASNGVFYTEIATQTTARNTAKNAIQTLETSTIPDLEASVQSLRLQEQQILSTQMNYEPRKHPNPAFIPQVPPVPNDPNQWLSVDQFMAAQGLSDLTTVRQNIISENTLLRGAKTSLASEKTRLSDADARITQINEERGRAEQALKDAQAKRADIDGRVAKLDKDINEQTAKYNKTQAEKELLETKWVAELDSIIRDATSARLHEELPLAARKIKERMEKRAEDEKNDDKKMFLEFVSQHYIGPDGRAIRANINQDRALIMRQGARVTFTWTEDGTTHNESLRLNGAEQTLVDVMIRAGLTQRQIYSQIKDPAALKEMSHDLAKEVLTTYLWSGGRLSRGEIVAIHKSGWGKGMVAEAIAGRADIQAQIDASIGKGVLNWHENILGQLGKLDWAKFALILLIIAGVIGGVGLLKK
jgi:hypothetical protein